MDLLDVHVAPEQLSVRANLVAKLASRTAKVGVVGIGYVGLPLAVEQAKAGFVVRGYDRNPIRVDQVNHGLNYIRDVVDSDLAEVVDNGKLSASIDFGSLHECDVIVICVPTPLTVNKDPDISYIRNVGGAIAERLRPGQLICLESTTYPGTTQEVLLPLLERSGLRVEHDFFLAFSPERVDPGNRRYTTKNTNKVIGGMTPACLDVAACFYGQTIVDVLRMSSPRAAEMTKVFENTFRAVNIALVNEMAILCDKLDIDIWEVVEAASTKPFGIMRFDPGPGVGGHCIPLDPFYLAWRARQFDCPTRFIELAGEINLSMPYFVRQKVARTLNAGRKALKNANILALGVAYKRDIADWRESPALKVIDVLERDGASVVYHDPLVSRYEDAGSGRQRHSVPLTETALHGADCVVILTDHRQIDWEFVVRHARRIVDTRNATRNVIERHNVVLL
jgi:UDP-N-acetyl-D-glucosamine dehydrogenase